MSLNPYEYGGYDSYEAQCADDPHSARAVYAMLDGREQPTASPEPLYGVSYRCGACGADTVLWRRPIFRIEECQSCGGPTCPQEHPQPIMESDL